MSNGSKMKRPVSKIKKTAPKQNPKPLYMLSEANAIYMSCTRAGFGSQWVQFFTAALFAETLSKPFHIKQTPNIIEKRYPILSSVLDSSHIRVPCITWVSSLPKSAVSAGWQKESHDKCKSLGWPAIWDAGQRVLRMKSDIIRRLEGRNLAAFGIAMFDVGIHVRGGDKLAALKKCKTNVDTQAYIKAFQQVKEQHFHKNTTPLSIYLATDDLLESSAVIEELKGQRHRVFIHEHDRGATGFSSTKFQQRKTPTVDYENWMLNLYTLTRCAYTIVTATSNMGLLVELMHAENQGRDRVINISRHIIGW